MTVEDWERPKRAAMAFRLEGGSEDDSFLVLMNAEAEPVTFALPAGSWRVVLGTSEGSSTGAVATSAHVVGAGGLVVMVAV